MSTNAITDERAYKIKKYIVKYLVRDYNFDEISAFDLVNRSRFSKLLEKDPDYALYYTAQDWADEIVQDEQLQYYHNNEKQYAYN